MYTFFKIRNSPFISKFQTSRIEYFSFLFNFCFFLELRNVQVEMLVKNDCVKFIYNFFRKEVRIKKNILFIYILPFFFRGPVKYTHYLFSIIDRNRKGTFTFDVNRFFQLILVNKFFFLYRIIY